MVKHCRVWTIVISVMMVGMLLVSPVASQNYWMYPGEGSSVSLEIHKPKPDGSSGLELLTSVWSLSGRIEATERMRIVMELPVSNLDPENGDGQTLIGNPYLGIENKFPMGDGSQYIVARFGGRPPLASDDKIGASMVGVWTLYNRFEAFYSDMTTFSGGFGYGYTLQGGTQIKANVDGALMIVSDDVEDELFLDYSFELWQPAGNANFGLGFAGRMLLSESEVEIGRRTEHQVGLAINLDLGAFQPGFQFRAPIEEYLTNVIDFTYGINLTYAIK